MVSPVVKANLGLDVTDGLDSIVAGLNAAVDTNTIADPGKMRNESHDTKSLPSGQSGPGTAS